MSLNLKSSGGGSVTVDVPSTASNYTATIQAADGTLSPLVSGTAQASTSGTSIDFTGIPGWVKRITVMFNGVSTNGTSTPQIQIGSGSVDTSGYSGGSWYHNASAIVGASYSSGLVVQAGNVAAASAIQGIATFALIGSNIWVGSVTVESASSTGGGGSTTKTLAGALDRVRITTVNGTDTFDAGSINILYE